MPPAKTKADYRAEITPAPPPARRFLERELDHHLKGGAVGVRQAKRIALRAAKQFERDLRDQWRAPTPFILKKASEKSDCSRGCARRARRWRPRFLAALCVTDSPTIAARVARIHYDTAFEHRKLDPDFARQWLSASDQAADLLQARGFQLALEGNLEPVYYMGVVVGHVRKYDGRLLVEMLRGLRPERFKTAGVNVSIAARGDLFVLSEAARLELQRVNRQWLEAHPPPERAALAAR
jgi:hypothetical protein